jgi:uncharacterized membrane protein YoaK (UPF0700 family)
MGRPDVVGRDAPIPRGDADTNDARRRECVEPTVEMHIDLTKISCSLTDVRLARGAETWPVTTERTTLPNAPAPPCRPDASARTRDRAVALLAALSGATDAVGLMVLGGSFTSVMTGNLVLVGVGIGTHDVAALGLTLTAVACYVAGVFVGARIAGEPRPGDPTWPPQVTRGLLVELACFALFAVAWWLAGGHPPRHIYAALLGLNALALGVQSSVIIRFGVGGLSTTYMTGTLTTMVARLAGRHPLASVGRSGALLAALLAGAAAAALACSYARALVPLLQLALIAGAVVVGVRQQASSRGRAR